ncbi:MAG: M48 family metallopeptidase [Desulfarculaceae bacterium]|nr:M48 family metallopeptidase [Desulfarculaceae bacterium]
MGMQSLSYGGQLIHYRVVVAPSCKKKISIQVKPDGSVQVYAPEAAKPDQLRTAVQKRARWIVTHVARARQRREHMLPRNYVSGESYFYLGRRYVLKVDHGNEGTRDVKLKSGQFYVHTDDSSPEMVKTLLRQWYRDHATQYLSQQLEGLVSRLPWVTQIPPWRLRHMTKRWGSCSPKRTLSLNLQLVKAPKECVEYVLLHELCHLREHNHSKRFYALLNRHMPNWRLLKERLDGMAEMLLNE